MSSKRRQRMCGHCKTMFAVPPRSPSKSYCSKRCQRREMERRRIARRAMEGALNEKNECWRQKFRGDPNPAEREGPTYELTYRLPGSYEAGKKR